MHFGGGTVLPCGGCYRIRRDGSRQSAGGADEPAHHDPKWPRAGAWPPPDGHADVAIVGIPTHLTSLSATNAHETPAAVREALQRYSLGTDLTIVDAGNTLGPVALDADLVIAIGGDNSATLPVALGRWGDGIRTAGLVTRSTRTTTSATASATGHRCAS